MTREAECIRQVENWSIPENYHKIDHPSFDPNVVKRDLPVVSPKLKKLLDTIQELDERDKKTDGTYYKHMIFSDVKSFGGAKYIASALLAYGFEMAYNKKFDYVEKKSDKKFALLCSNKLYEKEVGVKIRRKVLEKFNERPANVFGENIRFIVLDYGFKEGIDLFDIKYIHILETPITNADEKQIIGRGTRFCGQKGLQFHKKDGWILHVYRYISSIPKSLQESYDATSMFELFLKHSNMDISKINFMKDLESKCIQASIDFELNKPIHTYGQSEDSEFSKIVKEVEKDTSERGLLLHAKREVVSTLGMKIEKHAPFYCKSGCKGNAIIIPTELMLIVWYMMPIKVTGRNRVIYERKPRSVLCMNIASSPEFCKKLNIVWKKPEEYIYNQRKNIETMIDELPTHKYILQQKKDMKAYVKNVIDNMELPTEPPSQLLNYGELQNFMKLRYKKYVWPEIKLENLCIPTNEKKDDSKTSSIVFTPTQQLLQQYFQPKSAYKGMLLWHSVGTGKTCTAISIATNSFEKEGYTILWVTRNTLKGEIWKNMFKQICSISLQKKKDLDVEAALKRPLEFLPDNWMMPITYKQFSNLLSGKNQLYKEFVKKNGAEDPLKKTLIIIDEAHKLLSKDLKPQEKPNFEVLQSKIHKSYDVSKKDSVKVLLMTATPYSEDPMQYIKLLNLLRPGSDQIEEDFDIFKKKYLLSSGAFYRSREFLDKISGYISYLNRESDIRQFAHPLIKTIEVPMSESKRKVIEKEMQYIKEKMEESQNTVLLNQMEKKKAKEKLRYEKKLLAEKCKKIKDRIAKKECMDTVSVKEEEFKKFLFTEADSLIIEHEQKVKESKKKIQKLQNELKDFRTSDPSQERVLLEKCFKQDTK